MSYFINYFATYEMDPKKRKHWNFYAQLQTAKETFGRKNNLTEQKRRKKIRSITVTISGRQVEFLEDKDGQWRSNYFSVLIDNNSEIFELCTERDVIESV